MGRRFRVQFIPNPSWRFIVGLAQAAPSFMASSIVHRPADSGDEIVEFPIMLCVIVPVKEPPRLMTVNRVVGRVEVQHQLLIPRVNAQAISKYESGRMMPSSAVLV